MRRLINVLVSFAVAAICLSSCQEVIIESPVQDEAICEYSFALSTLDESTKATLDGVVVKWTEGDYAGVVAKYPGGSSYSYSNSNTKSTIVPATSSSPAKILVKSYNQLSAGGSVYCFFPYIDKEFKTPSIDMNISPSQDGSIDEMPMASIPFVVTENVPSKTGTDVGTINMVMLGSIARFNLYSTNSDYASETVKSITFTADKDIAGSFTYDISTVNYSNPESLEISVSGSDAVSVSGDMSVGSSKTDATVVDMVIAPGSYTGIVKVVTDAAEYTYNISTAKDFGRAHIKPLNIDLGKTGARTEIQQIKFNKVTSEPIDYSGVYLLVSEDYGIALDGSQSSSEMPKAANMLHVSPSDGVIECDAETINSAITIEKFESGYSLLTVGADYIGHTSNANTGIQGSEDPILNNIVWDNGYVKISTTVSSTKYTLAANPNPTSGVNNPLINYYKTVASTYKGISLYKLDDGKTDLSFGTEDEHWVIDLNATQTGVDIMWYAVEHASSYTVSYTGGTPEDIESEEDIYEFNIDNLEPGTYEVSVTANPASSQYRAATICKTVTVPDLNPVLIIEDIDIVADAKTSATEIPTTMENIDIVTFSGLFDDKLCEHESSSTWLTISDTNNIIKYTSTANTSPDSRSVYVKIEYVGSDADETEGTVVFKVTQAGKPAGASYTMITSLEQITAGVYVIGALRSTSATNDFYFATGNVSSGDMTVVDTKVTITDNNGARSIAAESLPSGAAEFTFTGDNTDGFAISASGKYLYFTTNSNRNLAFNSTKGGFLWKAKMKSSPLISGGVVLKYVKGSDSGQTGNYTISENSTAVGAIRGYNSETEYRAIYLFKKSN